MITLNDFPLELEEHKKAEIFYLDDEKFQLRDRMAYYHCDDFPIRMHEHDFFELNVVVQGVGCHYIEKNRFLVAAGDVLVIPPDIRHGYVPYDENNFSVFHLLMERSFFYDYSKEIDEMRYMHSFLNVEPMLRASNNDEGESFLHLNEQRQKRIFPFLNNLVHLAKKKSECAQIFHFYTLGLMGELAYYMFENSTDDKRVKNEVQLDILRSVNYMRTNFSECIKLNDLAKAARMSRTEYCQRFKKILKCPPMRYLLDMRLDKACRLLENSELSVTEVALECGFFDNSHFTRFFKRKYNVSPREYRRDMRLKRKK